MSEQRHHVLELVTLLIRVAYAEGFRAGAQWVPDGYNTEAQLQAHAYEMKHRVSTDEGLTAILTGAGE